MCWCRLMSDEVVCRGTVWWGGVECVGGALWCGEVWCVVGGMECMWRVVRVMCRGKGSAFHVGVGVCACAHTHTPT